MNLYISCKALSPSLKKVFRYKDNEQKTDLLFFNKSDEIFFIKKYEKKENFF